MPDDLRSRIAEALNACPAQFIQDDPGEGNWFEDQPYRRHDQHRYDGGCAMCRGETDTLADAMLAVVQPELDRLAVDQFTSSPGWLTADRDSWRMLADSANERAKKAEADRDHAQRSAEFRSLEIDRQRDRLRESEETVTRWRKRAEEAEAKVRADIAAAEADLACCRERLEDTRRIVAEWEDAAAERDRYRLAWQSARRRASGHQTAAHTFSDGGVDDIAELYRAQAAIQTAGGRLTKPVHQAIDAIRAKWDRALRSEQQKRADAEAALAADMRTWCSPHGLADHYADAVEQALGGTSVSSPAARQRQQDALYDQHVRSVVDRVVPENAIQVLKAGDEAGERQ